MLGCTEGERSGLPRRASLIGELEGVVGSGGVSCPSSDDDGSGTSAKGLGRFVLTPREVEHEDPGVKAGLRGSGSVSWVDWGFFPAGSLTSGEKTGHSDAPRGVNGLCSPRIRFTGYQGLDGLVGNAGLEGNPKLPLMGRVGVMLRSGEQ